jgi:hypothetical protein
MVCSLRCTNSGSGDALLLFSRSYEDFNTRRYSHLDPGAGPPVIEDTVSGKRRGDQRGSRRKRAGAPFPEEQDGTEKAGRTCSKGLSIRCARKKDPPGLHPGAEPLPAAGLINGWRKSSGGAGERPSLGGKGRPSGSCLSR